ncbi:TPA: helix-turn-helix transcriptional regulator [Enterobacter bugandensis]|nr:helix-turn-helix transcriptional regulator [Enterobacter bugandensis]
MSNDNSSDFNINQDLDIKKTIYHSYRDNMEKELVNLIREAKSIRMGTSLTQRQIAELTGIAFQNISRLERNGATPTLRLFIQYVYAMGYSVKLVKRPEDETKEANCFEMPSKEV